MSEIIIRTKAKKMYDAICEEAEQETKKGNFGASPGWFWNFKERTGVRSVRKVGESAEVDLNEVAKFVKSFARDIRRGGYTPDQIFNVDETGLFWKKRAGKTYTTKEQSNVKGMKMAKDRVTILLGRKIH